MKKYVIKIGTKLVLNSDGTINSELFENLASQIKILWGMGDRVVLVLSGAIVSGFQLLGVEDFKPDKPEQSIHDIRMAASIGQGYIFSAVRKIFKSKGFLPAQVLHVTESLNSNNGNSLKSSLNRYFESERMVIPIINENDPLNDEDLYFKGEQGDNDIIACSIAEAINANELIFLIIFEGFMSFSLDLENHTFDPDSGKLVSHLYLPDDEDWLMMYAKEFDTCFAQKSRGGMAPKFFQIFRLAQKGISSRIIGVTISDFLLRIRNGDNIGTKIHHYNEQGHRV